MKLLEVPFTFTARFGIPLEDEIAAADEITEIRTDGLLVGDCPQEQAMMQHYIELLRAKAYRIGAEPAEFRKVLATTIADVDFIIFDFFDLRKKFIPLYAMLRDTSVNPMPLCVVAEHPDLEAVLDDLDIRDSIHILNKPVIAGDLFHVVSLAAERKKELIREQKSEASQILLGAKPAVSIPDSLRGAKILLAEDNKINQMVAVELLKIEGFDVTVAENGRIAIELLEQKKFDLILMDVQMPEMDGLEATRRIRADVRFANLPILAMTANAMLGDRAMCIESGMNDHIAKPIAPQELNRMLIRWLRK